jgi:hypothetical protein
MENIYGVNSSIIEIQSNNRGKFLLNVAAELMVKSSIEKKKADLNEKCQPPNV